MVLEVNIDTECRIVMNSVNILFDSGVHQWEFFCMIFSLLIWVSKKQSEDKLLFSGSNELMVRGAVQLYQRQEVSGVFALWLPSACLQSRECLYFTH